MNQDVWEATRIVYNKSVCLIGGAFDRKLDLSRFDIVCWANNHYIPGYRCDAIVAIGCIPVPERLKKESLELLLVQTPGRHLEEWLSLKAKVSLVYCPFVHAGDCPHGPEQAVFARLHSKLETRPFTGINAINWFIHQPIRSLYVTGMTFYQRESDGAIPWCRGPHHTDPQRRWLGHQAEIDPRIELDQKLKELCTFPSKPRKIYETLERDEDAIWKVREFTEVQSEAVIGQE